MTTSQQRPVFVLCATVRETPIRDENGAGVEPITLPLSDRLLLALGDWADFYTELDGELSGDDTEPEVIEEFVGQGFKLAHRLRSELKGRTIFLVHPQTGERIEIRPSR